MKAMIRISEYNPSHYEKLAKAWVSLENGRDMTAFQSFDWFRNINRLCLDEPSWRIDRKLVYFLVENHGKPTLIAPLIIQRFGISFRRVLWADRGAHIIGAHGYSDYLNFIYDLHEPAAIEALFEYLYEKYGINKLTLYNLLADTQLAKYLLQTRTCKIKNMFCVALLLPKTRIEYDTLLSKSTKQNLRTATNRCKRDGIEFTYEIFPQIDARLIEEMHALRMRRLVVKHAKIAKSKDYVQKLKNFASKSLLWLKARLHQQQNPLLENARPWCLLVRRRGELVAFFWGISNFDQSELYVILAAVHPSYEWYSPGKLCLNVFINEIYKTQLGVRIIDFTRGGESYKYEIGGQDRIAFSWLETSLKFSPIR